MTVHDTVKVAGVSESCRYNDHSECRAPNCNCDCHQKALIEALPKVIPTGPEKACPKCGTRRPFVEVFCRVDGERLASLLCGVCGSGMNPEDGYCWGCGAPKGQQGKPRVVTVPQVDENITSATMEAAMYEQQVLRGLQEELSERQGDTEAQVDEKSVNQRVVEQPAGAQGSFKLVSAPNPNKLRASKPISAGATAVPRRLPIKPS